mmetsp:Transcript_34852/g.80599  ORF Transcript_34852/g.80599 Transcript_34852/m.80599 type:complete len:110 (+) Transcript_34852:1015-1344(+)
MRDHHLFHAVLSNINNFLLSSLAHSLQNSEISWMSKLRKCRLHISSSKIPARESHKTHTLLQHCRLISDHRLIPSFFGQPYCTLVWLWIFFIHINNYFCFLFAHAAFQK